MVTDFTLNQIPVISVGNVTLNQYDNFPTVIPGNATIVNNKTGLLSINDSQNYYNYFSFDGTGAQQSINVTYTAGYAQIPADIQYATARIVQNMFINIGADLTKLSESLPRYSYTARGDANALIDSGIRTTLSHYKDVGII